MLLKLIVWCCVFVQLCLQVFGCYQNCSKGFLLEISTESSEDISLCNNSYILSNSLSLQFGVIGIGYYPGNSSWTIPNNATVTHNYQGSGILIQNSKIKKSANIQEGIYSYQPNSSSLTSFLGIYNNDNQNLLLVSLQGNLIEDDDNLSSMSLELNCTVKNYPPTCIDWLINGTLLDTNATSTLIDRVTTLYSSVLVINSDTLVGNYTCTALSIGNNGSMSVHQSGTSQLLVEGPPNVLPLSLQVASPDTLTVQWEHDLHFLPSNAPLYYNVFYNEVGSLDSDYGNVTNCGQRKQCNITGLAEGVTYSIVIVTEDYDNSIFLPSAPYNITLEGPQPIELQSINSSLQGSTARIEWAPSLLQENVIVSYFASCHGELCTTETEIAPNNYYSIDNLIGGLSYTVSLRANNLVGTSSPIEFMIKQDPTVPILSPSIKISSKSSSSLSVSWDSVSCCFTSGELPLYTIQLMEYNTGSLSGPVQLSATQYTFTGLKPNTHYEVSLRTSNSIGSLSSTNTTAYTDSSAPTEPTNASTDGSFTTPTINSIPDAYYALAYIGGFGILVVLLVACIFCCIFAFILRSRLNKEYRHHKMDDADLEFSTYIPLIDRDKCEKPYLIEFPNSIVKATEGEIIYFLVQIAGTPEPTWFWQHQGEPISSQGHMQIFSDGTLIIDRVKPEDRGLYTFIARNIGGDIRQEVKLEVSVEDALEELESVRTQHARSLILDNKPVPIETLERYVEMQHSSDNEPFSFLFTSLSPGPIKLITKSLENAERNRYKNIVPYDDNIVELDPIPGWEKFQHTYINASYIDGYKTEKKFIATQGPLPYTIGDFWRMVWKERSPLILMLTNRIEGSRVKSEVYWPMSTSNELDLGPFVVKLVSEELYANFVIRKLTILLTDGSQSFHEVEHFHYTAWPDHGVPDHGSPLLLFHQKIMESYAKQGGPIITHCSAGVGRSGTFIALDIGLSQMKEEQQVDFVSIVNQLREKRTKMVQTSLQFMFLYDTLLEHVLCGNTLIPVAKLSETVSKLHEVGGNRKTGFETQFQLIRKITPKLDEYKCDVGKANPEKNRTNSLLPLDTRRVVLKGYALDYINASYIDGYQTKKEFIIAQSPTPATVGDFWRMIIQHKSCTIIMLCSLEENFKNICHQYWPSDADITVAFDQYSTKLINEVKESDNIIRRTLGIKDTVSGQSQTLVQFQVNNWLPDGKCSNHCTLGDLYNLVCDSQRRTGTGTKPIIVHCNDTVTRSAMYCATHNAIEQAKLEQASDIFQAVKTLRMQRPGSIPSVEHYQTVHELVSSCLSSYVMYSQFK